MAQVRVEEREGPRTATDVVIVVQPNDSPQLRNILLQQLPEMLRLFIKKNGEYGSGDASSGTLLGQRGQFADIWRKIGKLKTGIWDGNEGQLVTESVDEILRDLIGHCFLTLAMRQQEREAEYEDPEVKSIGETIASLPEFSDGYSRADVRNWLREHGWIVKRPDGTQYNASTDLPVLTSEEEDELFGPDA